MGILFEQASARGHLRESIHGEFDFASTIRNQVRASFSTLEAAIDMRRELLDYQREFSSSALRLADNDPVKGWIFGSSHDPASNHSMLSLLRLHQIEVHDLARKLEGFEPGAAYVVRARQPQYRLIMHPSPDPYATVALYGDSPLLAGYVHPENLERIRTSAALVAERVGRGVVISFVDNPNFRAFWTGTSKMFLNAIFLGSTIEKTLPSPTDEMSDHHGHHH